jgi:DnaJ-class molecular chaperone
VSWLIAAVAAYFAISFVKDTIARGKARSQKVKHRRAEARAPSRARPDEKRRPHEVLGVRPGASRAEIVAAYRKLAAQYHPDKLATSAPEIQELAARRLREINAAYGELRARAAGDDR